MQICGVNRREVRMSRLTIKGEGCVEEDEDEEEAMEEEGVSAKEEVSTTGWGGGGEEEEEGVAEEVEEIGIETKANCDII